MSISKNLALPYIMPSQAQKHVTHNEAVRALDALVQLSVISRGLSTPPQEAADGARFVVMAPAADGWSGHEDEIASKEDGAWVFYTPRTGWLAWTEDEQTLLVFGGQAWAAAAADGPAGELTELPQLGINAAADSVNKLAVASEASLLTHDGAGHNLKINKAAPTDTASLILQTNYSGRAEIGTTGDDDLHVKVTTDGTSWKEAIVVDGATGAVSFPNSVIAGGGSGSASGAASAPAVWKPHRDVNVGWMTHSSASLTHINGISNATFAPLRIGSFGSYSKISVYCQTGAAGATARIALYAAAEDNLIGALAADFGSVSCAATGMKTLDIAPVDLDAGLYYLVIQASTPSVKFRGGYGVIDSGAGIVSNILFQAGIGRIIFLTMTTPWPSDMTSFSMGAGSNQIQLVGSFFCPNMLLR